VRLYAPMAVRVSSENSFWCDKKDKSAFLCNGALDHKEASLKCPACMVDTGPEFQNAFDRPWNSNITDSFRKSM